MLRFLLVLTILTTLLRAQQPAIEVQLQSSFLVVREEATLTVTVRNLPVSSWPESPVVSPLSLQQREFRNMIINGRISKSFTYSLSGLRAGVFKIPPFQIGSVSSNSLAVTILPKDRLQRGSMMIDSQTYPYFSSTLIQNEKPFLGQTQAIEAKLYLPRELRVERLAFADFDKGDFVAWRFDPTNSSSGSIRLDGRIFNTYSYQSSLTPLAEGVQEFGPGTARPLLNFRTTRRGAFSWSRIQPEITFPQISLDVRPLPKPAPAGFGGAVGNFTLTTKISGNEVTIGDPITVEIAVNGTGNLDQLSAPRIMDKEKNFKQFDTTKKPQGSDRRSSTGTVEFSQLIRPQKITRAIPPYELSFFDPILQKYRTILSTAIPLIVKPGAAPAVIATEQSPLNFLTPSSFIIPSEKKSFPFWLWQIIPALCTLYLIYRKVFPKLREKQEQNAIQKEFSAELITALEASDRHELYRRAGKLIERWPHQVDDPDLQHIIAMRDNICFSPASDAEPALPKERSALKNILQRLSPILIISSIFIPGKIQAEDWKKTALERPTPEAFHNLALVEKEAGNLKTAALYLYRYQAYTGDDEPLTSLLSQTGGYRLRKPSEMEHLSILPPTFYHQAGIAALWSLTLIILLILNRKKNWLSLLIPLAVISGSLWGLGEKYYPTDISFKPLTELSVLMETTKVLNAPYDGATTGVEIPATSAGFIRGVSGDWANLEFPGGIKGWLPRQHLAPIQGPSLWTPPSQKD